MRKVVAEIEEKKQRRWWIFIVVEMITFATCLDSMAVNNALPRIANAFQVSMGMVEWVTTLNILCVLVTILVYGRLSDIKGKKIIFEIGTLIFMVGALTACFAQNFAMLLAGRAIAGTGSAAAMATNQGIIAEIFPPNERGKAMGIHGTVIALASMLGPSLGGFCVDLIGWHGVFVMGLPICLFGLLASIRLIPSGVAVAGVKLDKIGSAIFAGFIAMLYLAVKNLQYGSERYGYSIILFAIAAICGFVFVKEELHAKMPMLDFSLFQNKIFTVSLLSVTFSFFAISTNNFIMPFYLQRALGYSASIAGVLMMIYPIIMAITAPISGMLADKVGAEILCIAGLSVAIVGILMLSFLGLDTPLWYYTISVALTSFGFSIFNSPNTTLIMNNAPTNKMGAASSLNGLTRNLGNIFGISISTTVLYGLISKQVGYRTMDLVPGRADTFIFAMGWVYRLAAILCFVGLLLTVMRYIETRKK